MEITRVADLRPRFVWDIVDDAFDLYRERFFSFFWVTAAAYVPLILLVLTIINSFSDPAAKNDSFTIFMESLFVVLPFIVIASFIVRCATTELVAAYLAGGVFPRTRQIYGKVFKRFWSLLGALLFITFLANIGVFTSGLVTLYVWCVTIFIVPAILIEKRGFRVAYRRSYQLANANLGRALGLLFMTGILTVLLVVGAVLVLSLAFAIIPHEPQSAIPQASIQRIVQEIVLAIAIMLLEPISAIAVTLLYFDLRVRREGIDLVAAAQDAGVVLAADPFGDLPSDRVVQRQLKERRRR